MRIVILSIALLFCAFSAHSQVLKSAGVWYFLDVDSMTARPAVLPNGTELAYVIGTKTVYYWNRNTSTWTAYGSTFNRDSIYFDASIVGSGTLGDPWRVDSTLFATIAGVGDSIAAALSDYVEIADTAAMLSKYIERGDTLGMLSAYIRSAGWGLLKTSHTLTVDSTKVASRYYVSTLPTSIGNRQIAHSNGSNLIGNTNFLFTTTGNILLGTTTDVPTSIFTARSPTKSSSPFPLHTLAESDAITGIQGNFDYETTQNGLRWYNGTRKAYALESTFARGTATRVPFFDANGQIKDNAALTFVGDQQLIINSNPFSSTTAKIITASNGTNNGGETGLELINLASTVSGRASISVGNVAATSPYLSIRSRQTASPFALTERMRFNGDETISMYNNTVVSANLTAQKLGIGTTTFGSIIADVNKLEIHAENEQAGMLAVSWDNSGTFPNTSLGGGFVMGKARGTKASPSNVAINDRSAYFLNTNYAGSWQNTAGISFYIDGAVSSGVVPTQIRFETGTSTASRATRMTILSGGNIGAGTASPTEQFHVNDDIRIGDSTRLTTTPAHTSITGLLTRDANGWVGAASLAGGLSYSGGVLTGANIYTTDGTLPTGGARTINMQHSSKVYFQNNTNDKAFWTELYDVSGNSFQGTEIFNRHNGTTGELGLKNYAQTYTGLSFETQFQSTANTTNAVGGMFNEITGNRKGSGLWSGLYNSNAEPVAGVYIAGDSLTISSTTSKTHFAGLVRTYNKLGSGSNGRVMDRSNKSKYLIQTRQGGSSNGSFNWIEIRNMDDDTTGNYISFYEKYDFPNASPGTGRNVHVWDNGTPAFVEIKRDTTIYIDDADYDWSAVITTAQIAARYNRVIFWMTTTGSAGSDSEITLHAPDANLMQVEYIIHSVDEAGGFSNKIVFGTNNAVDSTNGLVTNYFPAAGQGVHIRAGLRSAVYKYRYY